MTDKFAYGLIVGIVLVFLMMARILQWWLRVSAVKTVKLALKGNLILFAKYTGTILLFGILIEKYDSGTSGEVGWPDLFPALCVLVWGIIFLIHLLILWLIAEINLWIQFIKNKN